MATSKIAITIDEKMLKQIDNLVQTKYFPNRSKAIQDAVAEKLARLEKNRLAQECAKIDPHFEQSSAEEGFSVENEEWPERTLGHRNCSGDHKSPSKSGVTSGF